MTSKIFEILNKKGKDRAPLARYEIFVGCLDGNSMYEEVSRSEGNHGYLTVYRDSRTTTAISIEVDPNQDHTFISLFGDNRQIRKTLEDITSITPKIFRLKAKSR